MDLDAGHSDDGAHFSRSQALRRCISAHSRAFGSALIRCIYSKPQTEERWRWQSTSVFLARGEISTAIHYCTLAITKLLAVKNCA